MVEMIRLQRFCSGFKHSNKKVHAIYTRVDYEKDVKLSRKNHEKGNEIAETEPHYLIFQNPSKIQVLTKLVSEAEPRGN